MKCLPKSETFHRRHRHAFTLLETMLALSLSALLLAAIYAAIDQSWRTAASGREEMERAQLARALIHKIEVDIRAITFVPPKPVEETDEATGTTTGSTTGSSTGAAGTGSGGSTSGGSTGSSGNRTSTGNTSGGGANTSGGRSTGGSTSGGASGAGGGSGRTAGASSGMSGSSGTSGASRSSGTSTSGSTGSSSSGAGFGGLAGTNTTATGQTSSAETSETTEPVEPNSKSVGIRGTSQKFEISISRPRRDLLPGTAAMASSSRTSDLRQVSYSFMPTGSSPAGGLIRTEGDRMAVETLEANGGVGTQISSVQMLAPEVSAFRVRYFDGRTWSETWDTETMGRIPRAVEVSIGFAPPKKKPPIFSAPVSRSMDSFRTVILIPVSDPYPQDFVE